MKINRATNALILYLLREKKFQVIFEFQERLSKFIIRGFVAK